MIICVSLAQISNDAFPITCLNQPRLILIRHSWVQIRADNHVIVSSYSFIACTQRVY